jgi:hypothetical protein
MCSRPLPHRSITGWSDIPRGYSAYFDWKSAPIAIRVLSKLPWLDRYAYPFMVKNQLAYLRPHPGFAPSDRAPVPSQWVVDDEGDDATDVTLHRKD